MCIVNFSQMSAGFSIWSEEFFWISLRWG